jgi:hypothetical protein
MPKLQSNITALIENFARQLVAATEASAAQRIREALAEAFGVPQKRGPGRPKALASVAKPAKATRPKQLCPVPGCKNPAAPVFGMVCAKHKDVPKAQIKKYREQRKAKGAAAATAKLVKAKPAKPSSAKLNRARKLQGQYLGALRGLGDADRSRVKQAVRTKGVVEALKLAKSLKTARK